MATTDNDLITASDSELNRLENVVRERITITRNFRMSLRASNFTNGLDMESGLSFANTAIEMYEDQMKAIEAERKRRSA